MLFYGTSRLFDRLSEKDASLRHQRHLQTFKLHLYNACFRHSPQASISMDAAGFASSCEKRPTCFTRRKNL